MHDIVVLGGGPGGYASALYAHNFGLDVALVVNERPGGTCLLRGCIPAKQWLQIAEVFSTVKHASDFGVVASEPDLDWDAALERKGKTVEGLVRGLEGLLKKRNVTLVTGYGRLDGPTTVAVGTDDGEQRLEGRHVIFATGSHARSIPGYEIDGERIVTSDHALDWPSRPQRVAIVGGGVIGCEFASMLADLGSEVHVFEVLDQILPGTDATVARQLERQLSRKGVRFHTGVAVEPPKIGASTVVVPFGGESVEVDVVLMSVGRGPNTEDVGLESTKAKVDRGFVVVDRSTMQTADPSLYAVGDVVAGTPQLAHVGFAEGIAAVTHIATGKPAPVDYRAIPRITYSHPEVAEVGYNEAQAAEAGLDVETYSHGFGGVGRAIIIGQTQGTVKLVVEKGGPIVGASIVGPQAGEMIHELMYAVGWEALPSEAAAFIHAHPTLSEAVGETLLTATGRSLH
ncbi:MAG TPA: dihydrolipoyl dehydrogenase [Acidimicrobiia bacterium]|nr:dihydrolipoyl dehydrogenase [Acidimicrobiia bacterium]